MKLLAIYGRGVGVSPIVLIEGTVEEAASLGAGDVAVGAPFDLPPMLADARVAGKLAGMLRAAADKLSPQEEPKP